MTKERKQIGARHTTVAFNQALTTIEAFLFGGGFKGHERH